MATKNAIIQPETRNYLAIAIVAAILLTASFYLTSYAVARPSGATVSPGTDDYGPTTATASSDPARGGVITQLDINASVQTNNWQGYYGFISQYIYLADSTEQIMYSWNVSSPDGYVLAGRASTINVSGLVQQQTCTVEDSVIGDAVTDKVSATFTNTTASDVIIGNRTLTGSNGTCTVDLFVDNQTNTTWEENLLYDGNGQYVYQVSIQNYGNEIFNGENKNYMMMVPEDEAGAAGTTNYFFWLELQ